MIVIFAQLLYDIEWDEARESCVAHWLLEGINRSFINANPIGVTWNCNDVRLAQRSPTLFCFSLAPLTG